jgi:hypothetical protein
VSHNSLLPRRVRMDVDMVLIWFILFICLCLWFGSAETKLEMEQYFKTHHPTSTIIRPSLVFGPGDSFFTVSSTSSSHATRIITDLDVKPGSICSASQP